MQLRRDTCTGLLQKWKSCASLKKDKFIPISMPHNAVNIVHCKGLAIYMDTKFRFFTETLDFFKQM